MRLKLISPAVGLTAASIALTAGSASATTLELNGVTQNNAVGISASLTGEDSLVQARTDGTLVSTCTAAALEGSTSTFTGSKVTGALSTLWWAGCSAGNPTVHKPGQLYIEHEPGTTNGNVFSENAEWTLPTSLGFTVTCKTNEGTKLGTLTGVKSGRAIFHVNAVLNCGFLLPSAAWTGTYTITNSRFGVSA